MLLHFNKGLAGAAPEAIDAAKNTAINPAVLDAFALLICAAMEPPAYPGIPGHEPDLWIYSIEKVFDLCLSLPARACPVGYPKQAERGERREQGQKGDRIDRAPGEEAAGDGAGDIGYN